MKFNFNILLVALTLLTTLTRFVGLDYVPNNLSNDEISIAYDAYSISKTSRDEHNHFLPLSFQSHNTYKAPLTIYLSVPTTIIFGNNEFSARLPSAILGSLTVLLLGLLVFQLSSNKTLAILSSFILSISPIHILTSRMAYEPNISLFFFVLGIYLFFLSLKKNTLQIIAASFTAFALSIYGYHTHWVLTPLTIVILLAVYLKKISLKVNYLLGVTFFILLTAPVFLDFAKNLHTTTRANTENLLRDPSIVKRLENPTVAAWQKGSFIIQAFIEKYSSYFNLSYLFFTGYSFLPKGDPFQVGIFLFIFLPFLFIGLTKLNFFFKEHSTFVYIFLFVSPLTASLTSGPQSTSRNLVSVIPLSIVYAVGLFVFWQQTSKIWRRIFLVSFSITFLYFLVIFYYHFPKDSGEGFQYGYKQIALFIKPRYQDYQQIIIDPRFGPTNMYAGLPHLYISYFTYLNPRKLLEAEKNKDGISYDKYQVRNINWNIERIKKDNLYIVPASNRPSENLKLKEVYNVTLPNLQPAFYLYQP